MEKLKIFLSGAVKNENEKFQDWRIDCCKWKGTSNLDPLDYFDYLYNPPQTDRQCIDLFMWMVEQSDVVLVNLNYSEESVGAGMEVEHAFCKGIPIIGFGKTKVYSWIETQCTAVFEDLQEAMEYVWTTYRKIKSGGI